MVDTGDTGGVKLRAGEWVVLCFAVLAIAAADATIYFFAERGLGTMVGVTDAILKKFPGWIIGACGMPLLYRAARNHAVRNSGRSLAQGLGTVVFLTILMMTVGVLLIRLIRGRSLDPAIAVQLVLEEFSKNLFFTGFLFTAFFFVLVHYLSRRYAAAGRKAGPESPASEAMSFLARGEILRVMPDEIDYLESAGNYVTIVLDGRRELVRETMRAIVARLPTERFVRIHRRWIVPLEKVQAVYARKDGGADVVLRCGVRLEASRAGRAALQGALSRHSALY